MRKKVFVKASLLVCALCVAGLSAKATESEHVFSVGDEVYVQFAEANVEHPDPARGNLWQWEEVSGLESGEWRVLKSDEWSYLLADGRADAENLNAIGQVEGQNGLIILPDGWKQTSDLPEFNPASVAVSYDINSYDAAEWALLAASGAVFLPCNGMAYMDGGTYKIEDVADHGAYWAADEVYEGSTKAYSVRFNDGAGDIHDRNEAFKTNFYSVRLVKEVEAPEPTGIAEVRDDEHAKKLIRNGQMVLVLDGESYSVGGQKLQ